MKKKLQENWKSLSEALETFVGDLVQVGETILLSPPWKVASVSSLSFS